jgi:hypothetical protein
MAARGAVLKEAITAKILKTFQGSFVNGKEIRIPGYENGELVQVKVTLIAAKDNIEGGEAAIVPTPTTVAALEENVTPSPSPQFNAPDEQEIANMKNILTKLNF